jgi:hypothetical protein
VHFTPDLVQHDRVSSMAMTLSRSRQFTLAVSIRQNPAGRTVRVATEASHLAMAFEIASASTPAPDSSRSSLVLAISALAGSRVQIGGATDAFVLEGVVT